MIFFIICIVAFILMVIGSMRNWEEEGVVFSASVMVISFCIGFCFIFSGMTDYPYIAKEKQEIQTLVNGIDDVRNANYKSLCTSKHIIHGSIENMKQSTNLSMYISEITKQKAKFNGELKKIQIYEGSTLYNFIFDGFFISSDVQNIELIK